MRGGSSQEEAWVNIALCMPVMVWKRRRRRLEKEGGGGEEEEVGKRENK